MSDLRLYNSKTSKLVKKVNIDKQSLKSFVEKNSFDLLGLQIVALNYPLVGNSYDLADIYYDENYQLVLVEYRVDRFSNIINKGLGFLDFIAKNQGKMKTLFSEKLGLEISKQINLKGRLISIGSDFNEYDYYAIKQLPYTVDLIKFQVYEKDLFLLEKIYQSKRIDGEGSFINNYREEINLYKSIAEFILSLGDDICEVHATSFICYRKITNFIYLYYDNGINLKLKENNSYKTVVIKNIKNFEKYKSAIEKCYDES